MSVDTLLNRAEMGTKAHTSERLTSLLRQMPLRFGEGQKQALACLVKANENSGRGQGGDGEDCDAWFDPEECCDGTLLVTLCHRLSIGLLQQSRQMWNGLFTSAIMRTTQSVDYLPILISAHSVVFKCACDARACVVLHISESLMMLCTPEMRGIINNLPLTEDERMETFQLSVLSAAAFRYDRPIHLLKHMECWRVAPQHEQ